ncbi:uncharacterized protein BO97DRAFT_31869 [Aspergillus homomorphus CBS 101889]|uniref:Secreted protein n=1 Tax=Aspergillus homomorphus (strain CBS 101889) TaxID=1450537 RepID=A0A395I1Q7_ASPHC|nr:hypothetical protein BO97DRAFT_31869 [Aspergillus homomorphus CBS 101889]RAL13573.1 hypothetical protein BO97DRAFT_31869 [Aspergillus homomorphus CBS 101889]
MLDKLLLILSLSTVLFNPHPSSPFDLLYFRTLNPCPLSLIRFSSFARCRRPRISHIGPCPGFDISSLTHPLL